MYLLDPAFVAPETDVEAVGEAEAEVAAGFGEPWCGAVEFLASPAFRHEDGAVFRDLVGVAESLDFGEVGFVCDDEFEPGFWGFGKKRESIWMDS